MLKSALKALERSKSWEKPIAEKINVTVNNNFFMILIIVVLLKLVKNKIAFSI